MQRYYPRIHMRGLPWRPFGHLGFGICFAFRASCFGFVSFFDIRISCFVFQICYVFFSYSEIPTGPLGPEGPSVRNHKSEINSLHTWTKHHLCARKPRLAGLPGIRNPRPGVDIKNFIFFGTNVKIPRAAARAFVDVEQVEFSRAGCPSCTNV